MLTEKGKQAIETFVKVLPKIPEQKQEELLKFGEGMAFMVDKKKKKKPQKSG